MRGRKRSASPCLDQIPDAGIYISDIFVIRFDSWTHWRWENLHVRKVEHYQDPRQ
jgi:hypothetical protein